MEISVKRFEASTDGRATVGCWYTNGVYRCYTLEDRIREIVGQPAESWKIPGETAIPMGRYRVVVDQSPAFSLRASKKMGRPIQVWTGHLLNVPRYSGIRVHGGNSDKDTEGCILLGLKHPAEQDYIGGSRAAVDIVQPEIEEALGIRRVPGPPECWSAGTIPTTLWHYEQVGEAEDVWITITNGFPVAVDPALTAE